MSDDGYERTPWKYEGKVSAPKAESIWNKPLFKSSEATDAQRPLFESKVPKVVTAADYYTQKIYYLLYGVLGGIAIFLIGFFIKGH
jgi:hypothetical protein